MSEKYAGWSLKIDWGRKPYFIHSYFHEVRRKVIKDFEETTGLSWRKFRRRGTHKVVKVKLVEVKNTCQKPDRDFPKLICGFRLPCPHHKEVE